MHGRTAKTIRNYGKYTRKSIYHQRIAHLIKRTARRFRNVLAARVLRLEIEVMH